MQLTIEQALQQAVEAHKAGKLQDAEALYRAILHTQPKHPDANHNLGVLAVSVNKLELALPLFKTALEVNPSQGQFWISYVDALIKANQLDSAKSVLEQGRKLGLSGEAVDALDAQLSPIAVDQEPKALSKKQGSTFAHDRKKVSAQKEKKKSLATSQTNPNQIRNSSQSEMALLLDHYQKGRYDLAEDLGRELTQQYPNHQFSWKVLGAVFKQTGRLQESLVANEKAVAISPNDAEAHNNLGATFQELGRFEDAETSYKKAIALKPDFAEALSNMGFTLKELGRLEQSETKCKKAIALKPDYAEAHNNLGVTLLELGRLEEAEASYKKAIAYKPDYAEAQCNLGATLHELGRPKEAEECYSKAIAIKPDYAEAHYNFGLLLYGQGKYKQAADELIKSRNFKRSQRYILRCLYFLNDQIKFYEQLDSLISQGEVNALVGSFSCRAEVKYGILKPNPFCNDPLNYVFKNNLTKDYDFTDNFIKPALAFLNNKKIDDRKQILLTNGRQTAGNLFALENNLIYEIKKIITLEIEKYRHYFKDSDEGLIKNWPDVYSLYGWIISMKSGGELRPHMHENGWLSGSIYINVPPKKNTNDGNLVVCIEDDQYLIDPQINKKNIIDVTTGDLCLFPASLLHYTIPFESDEDRVVLAFDVVPK